MRGIVREEPLQVGAVTLTEVTDEGEFANHDDLFTMKAEPGELLVMYFGYTNCPDLCPTTLAAVRTATKNLGDDGAKVDLAMATVDMERDTPEVLNGYLSSFSDHFHALHASSQEELEAAENAFLASSTIQRDAAGKIEVGHSATAYVVNDQGVVLVEWPFGIDSEAMTNDLKILLEQISSNN
jgi:protein SCO1/2